MTALKWGSSRQIFQKLQKGSKICSSIKLDAKSRLHRNSSIHFQERLCKASTWTENKSLSDTSSWTKYICFSILIEGKHFSDLVTLSTSGFLQSFRTYLNSAENCILRPFYCFSFNIRIFIFLWVFLTSGKHETLKTFCWVLQSVPIKNT